MASRQEDIINRVLKLKLPLPISGEVAESVIRGLYDEFEKDIKLIVEGL